METKYLGYRFSSVKITASCLWTWFAGIRLWIQQTKHLQCSWIRIKRGLVVNNYLRETWSPLWLSLDLKEEGSHFAYMMGRTSWANRDFLLVNLPFIGIFQHKNLWPWSLWLCSTVPDCTAGLRKTFPDCNLEIINHWFIYFLSLLMSKMHTAESYQISRFDTEREKWIFFKAGLSK